MRGHSTLIGSFTFMIISLSRHTVSASGAIVAPTATKSSSANPLPRPAPVSMSTEWPAPTKVSAPAGTRAMRFSFVLISFGTPIFMGSARSGVAGAVRRACHRSELLAWSERHDGLSLRSEELARNLGDLLRGHRIDEREHLVEGAVGFAVQLDGGGAIHPSRDALEGQRDLPLELALAHREL